MFSIDLNDLPNTLFLIVVTIFVKRRQKYLRGLARIGADGCKLWFPIAIRLGDFEQGEVVFFLCRLKDPQEVLSDSAAEEFPFKLTGLSSIELCDFRSKVDKTRTLLLLNQHSTLVGEDKFDRDCVLGTSFIDDWVSMLITDQSATVAADVQAVAFHRFHRLNCPLVVCNYLEKNVGFHLTPK